MKTEKEKMLSGGMYDAKDPQLTRERLRARELCHRLNSLSPETLEKERKYLIEQLLGEKSDLYITPPFHCDYGTNISVGENVYFNFNCVVLDVAKITIGDNAMFGPNVQLLTASHPINALERRGDLEFGRGIEIGDDVWIGGGAILCPGVKVGSGAVIGAGGVVTKDVLSNTVVAGNPCKVIKNLA
ncbi:MAG: sugar O-acetyltransferase [Proteobacteria bacterium]|nr:sugar O-acetyltransferase [Pseudomonadota bacterium]